MVFDDKVEIKGKDILPFFTLGRHENTDVYYLIQRYLELLLPNTNDRKFTFLPKQTAK